MYNYTMYYQSFYHNKTEHEITALVKKEGFNPIKFHDDPGYTYSPHKHPETKLLAFLEGSMEVTVDGFTFTCIKGDKLIIPGNIVHSARVGADGCVFLWSEKLI